MVIYILKGGKADIYLSRVTREMGPKVDLEVGGVHPPWPLRMLISIVPGLVHCSSYGCSVGQGADRFLLVSLGTVHLCVHSNGWSMKPGGFLSTTERALQPLLSPSLDKAWPPVT